MGDWYQDRNGEWQYDAEAPTPNVEATEIRPYTRAVLDAIHGDPDVSRETPEAPRAGDIGDWIDPNAPDPTPPVVTDRSDPNYVDPWFGDR
jgi:hypothetical protein